MAVTKRTRYEVLRRDGHSCRYCGATAADSPLTVDHVIPVALGGSDAPDNLVAACQPCNSGKAATSPDETMVASASQDALRWSAAIKRAAEIRAREVDTREALYDYFEAEWNYGDHDWRPNLPGDWKATVWTFHSLGLSTYEIREAIEIALNKYGIPLGSRWRYFCGICWNKIRDLQEAAAEIASAAESDDEDGDPSDEVLQAWDRAFREGEEYGAKAVHKWHTAGIASGLILEHVIDGLHHIPDELKWSA